MIMEPPGDRVPFPADIADALPPHDDDDVSRPIVPCRTCGTDVHPDTAWGDCDDCAGLPGECPAYCSKKCYHGVVDTRDILHQGRTLTVTLVVDNMTDPTDADCYTDEDIAAWERGEWCYVGVLITEGTAEIADLWEVEYGRLDSVTTIDMDRIISDHPVPDMLEGK